MTPSQPEGGLRLEFADPVARKPLGTSVALRSTVLAPTFDLFNVGRHTATRRNKNPWARVDGPYRRAFFYYHEFTQFYSPLGFLLENGGPDDLSGVRIETGVPAEGGIQVVPPSERPAKPSAFPLRTRIRDPREPVTPGAVKVRQSRQGWLLRADLGQVGTGETARTTGPFYVGSSESVVMELAAGVDAEELQEPVEFRLRIRIQASEEPLTVKDLLDALKAYEARR